jgi:hypothetical protein
MNAWGSNKPAQTPHPQHQTPAAGESTTPEQQQMSRRQRQVWPWLAAVAAAVVIAGWGGAVSFVGTGVPVQDKTQQIADRRRERPESLPAASLRTASVRWVGARPKARVWPFRLTIRLRAVSSGAGQGRVAVRSTSTS